MPYCKPGNHVGDNGIGVGKDIEGDGIENDPFSDVLGIQSLSTVMGELAIWFPGKINVK